MNHPLAVYTAVYLAIIFVTVSIWSGGLVLVDGDGRALLATQGFFALKVAIDDYVHFQSAPREKLQADLTLSLLIYILLAVSIAGTGTNRLSLAVIAFIGVVVTGIGWVLLHGIPKTGRGRPIG